MRLLLIALSLVSFVVGLYITVLDSFFQGLLGLIAQTS